MCSQDLSLSLALLHAAYFVFVSVGRKDCNAHPLSIISPGGQLLFDRVEGNDSGCTEFSEEVPEVCEPRTVY